MWSSFAHIADWCILLVRTDPDAPKHQGITYLLVDMHSDGVEVRPLNQITGEPEFNEIFFNDVRVPIENVLGEVNAGWGVAMTTLLHERGTLGLRAHVPSRGGDEQARDARPGDGGRATTPSSAIGSRGNGSSCKR